MSWRGSFFLLFLLLHPLVSVSSSVLCATSPSLRLRPLVFLSSRGDHSNTSNMQSLQRKFGQMTTKRSADDSQVAILMKDFEDADALLAKVRSLPLGQRDDAAANSARSSSPPEPGAMPGSQL